MKQILKTYNNNNQLVTHINIFKYIQDNNSYSLANVL